MNSHSFNGRTALAILFACIFIVMLAFSFLAPMVADDYLYSFSFADGSRMTSVSQIMPSMQAHRTTMNGRVVAHAAVQLFLIMPKYVFNIANALLVTLLAFLFYRFFKEGNVWHTFIVMVCGTFMIFNFTPVFGQTFLWLDGALNYSWGFPLFLIFLWPYILVFLGKEFVPSRHAGFSTIRILGFLLLAIVVGTYSENGSIATIFVAVCFSVLHIIRKRKLPWPLLCAIGCAVLGYLFLLSAPATTDTLSTEFSLYMFIYNIRCIVTLSFEYLLPLYIIFTMALVLCFVFGANKDRLILSIVLFLGGLVSLASFSAAAYFTFRHFFYTVLITTLACMILFSELLALKKKLLPSLIVSVMTLLFAFNFVLCALDLVVLRVDANHREALIQEALASGETELLLYPYRVSNAYNPVYSGIDIQENPEHWMNIFFADYYGLDSVAAVEREYYDFSW